MTFTISYKLYKKLYMRMATNKQAKKSNRTTTTKSEKRKEMVCDGTMHKQKYFSLFHPLVKYLFILDK